MALEAGSIVVRIDGDTTDLESALNKMNSQMKKAGVESKKSGQKIKGMTGSLIKSQLAITVVTKAFRGLVNNIKGSITKFTEQERVERALETALGKTSKALLNQASALQQLTKFGDEEIIQGQAFLAQMGLEEDQIKKLLPSILNLAEAKGMSLSQASDLVAKSVGSTTNALSRYGIEIKGIAGSTDRLESAVLALDNKFKGQAETARKTLGGAFKALQNNLGDLQEQTGKKLEPVLKFVTEGLINLTEKFKKSTEEVDFKGLVEKAINAFTSFDKGMMTFLVIPLRRVIDFIRLDLPQSWKTFVEIVKATGAGLKETFEALIDPTKTLSDAFGDTAFKIEQILFENEQVFKNWAKGREDDFKKAFDAMDERANKWKDSLNENIEENNNSLDVQIDKTEDARKKFKEFSDQVKKDGTAQTETLGAVGKSILNLVKAIQSSSTGMAKAFGIITTALNVVGETATQVNDLVQQFFQAEIERIDLMLEKRLESLQEQQEAELEAKGLQEEDENARRERELKELEKAAAKETDIDKKKKLKEQIQLKKDAIERAKIEKKFQDKKEKEEKKAAKKKHELEVKAFKAGQATALLSAGISVATGIANAWAAAASAASVSLIAAPAVFAAVGAALTAVIAGAGAAQIAVIASKQPPQANFATGGVVGGVQLRGDNINSRLDAGEVVFTRNRFNQLINALDNGLVGNRQPQVMQFVLDGEIVQDFMVNNQRRESFGI